jgi:hypothetical protein
MSEKPDRVSVLHYGLSQSCLVIFDPYTHIASPEQPAHINERPLCPSSLCTLVSCSLSQPTNRSSLKRRQLLQPKLSGNMIKAMSLDPAPPVQKPFCTGAASYPHRLTSPVRLASASQATRALTRWKYTSPEALVQWDCTTNPNGTTIG